MYYQIYRMEFGHKVVVGFATNRTDAIIIMQAEREKVDSEMQIGMEQIEEDQQNGTVYPDDIYSQSPQQ